MIIHPLDKEKSQYSIALINGAGLNARDNNNDKDVVGRLTVSPVDAFTIGVSGYTGKGQIEGAAFSIDETAYGADAEYGIKDLGLSLRAEYVKAKWKNWGYNATTTKWEATNSVDQEPNGWYLQGAYNLPPLPNLQVMARYEDYEKDSNTQKSHLKTTTVGLTYYLKEKTRISANYLFRDADSSQIVTAQETTATGNKIGNLFLVQMLVSY